MYWLINNSVRFLPINGFKRFEKQLFSIQTLEAHSHLTGYISMCIKKKVWRLIVFVCLASFERWVTKTNIFGILCFFILKKAKTWRKLIKRYVQCMVKLPWKNACARSGLRDFVPEIFLSKTHHARAGQLRSTAIKWKC